VSTKIQVYATNLKEIFFKYTDKIIYLKLYLFFKKKTLYKDFFGIRKVFQCFNIKQDKIYSSSVPKKFTSLTHSYKLHINYIQIEDCI